MGCVSCAQLPDRLVSHTILPVPERVRYNYPHIRSLAVLRALQGTPNRCGQNRNAHRLRIQTDKAALPETVGRFQQRGLWVEHLANSYLSLLVGSSLSMF